MKDLPARFCVPLDVPRSRGARLLEAFSPKLNRRVQFFNHHCFEQWVWLESDSSALAICERPTRVGPKPDDRVVDFWVRRSNAQELVLVETSAAEHFHSHVEDLPVRTVTLTELAAARTWIDNWKCMLPVINATRTLLPKGIFHSILRCVHQPTALAWVERELSTNDPAIARGAIFELLRTGRLLAPSLHVEALSMHTLLHSVSCAE